MITGFEGQGKSEFLRQMAVCIAAGVDPLRFNLIEPRRVLFIDCENSDRQTRRRLRPLSELIERTKRPVGPKMMYVLTRPNGLDLTEEGDAAWLHERVIAHRPELLIIGPLYKLHEKNPNDELAARLVVRAIDDARSAIDCAVVIEAHAGHGEAGRQRNVRPTGSSLWLRWPEFGYGLVPTGKGGTDQCMEFRRWRGPRGDRQWPDELHRGTVWPWQGVWNKGMPKLEIEPPPSLLDEEPF
jgi:RecA-family ATPase